MSTMIKTLGYQIEYISLRPDPARLQGLMELRIPKSPKELSRLKGVFAYYARWVKNFSAKIAKLSDPEFTLSEEARVAIKTIKEDIAGAVRVTVDPSKELQVETDASEYAIGAVLSQEGQPVAFFSRTLNKSERTQSSIEKEASACVEAIKKWSCYLSGRKFGLVTDQQAVSSICVRQTIKRQD